MVRAVGASVHHIHADCIPNLLNLARCSKLRLAGHRLLRFTAGAGHCGRHQPWSQLPLPHPLFASAVSDPVAAGALLGLPAGACDHVTLACQAASRPTLVAGSVLAHCDARDPNRCVDGEEDRFPALPPRLKRRQSFDAALIVCSTSPTMLTSFRIMIGVADWHFIQLQACCPLFAQAAPIFIR